jgi:hypothetical protein
MSDDRCPEHNCDIAACFGKHQGGTMNEAFEQWWSKTTSGVDWVSETEEQAKTHAWLGWEAALTHLHEFFKAERDEAFREPLD